ncbi:MAG: DNA mismatch repair protein MutS, partial [Vicinamibacterales bacterium]
AAPPTPAMRQYLEAKRQNRDAIVFFRMGDFYEMFYEDALVAARALELALTSRSKDAAGTAIPMCGVPHHAAEGYIARLVKKGFRVAICEQIEDPRKAKGLVQRAVVRVVSPGTLIDAGYLDGSEPAFLLCLAPSESKGRSEDAAPRLGAALIDLSTGEFSVSEYDGHDGMRALSEELLVIKPRELLVPTTFDAGTIVPDLVKSAIRVTPLDPFAFAFESAQRTLCDQLQTSSLDGFGLAQRPVAVVAAGALVHYLRDTQKVDLAHVRTLRLREFGDVLLIDATTVRHLSLFEGPGGDRNGSLLQQLDRTRTPMGTRLLRSWLARPLARIEPLHDRLDAVEELAFRTSERGRLREALKSLHDIERLVSRAALGTATPRDLVALQQSLSATPRIRAVLSDLQAPLIRSVSGGLDELPDLSDLLARTLVDSPPAQVRDGGAIRDGVDAEIDELRGISRSGRDGIAEMEEAERARTGIPSLKVRYNRVFGYYIEVSKANLHAVPADYHRKQTIAGGERFITPALKAFEERVLGADERILEREVEIFEGLRQRVAADAPRVQETARALATVDVLAALAEVATICNYTKPQMHEGDELLAYDTRHPVVEQHARESFVPNDVTLNASTSQLVVLTGPNMGGKSTYLRQVALLCVMAQVGSFVPARHAKLPLIDRVFARVGASDDIVRGQSTFMVEMQETARILHTATSHSLVVLDEIGRGTATFDGLSIAWAVAEHLARHAHSRPKTLFATHYHELTDLADSVPGVVNAHVEVREWKDDIVFLRKVVPGRSDRSYGIQVARLAGLPPSVVARAREILTGLERDELTRGGRPSLSPTAGDPVGEQLGLFQSAVSPQQHTLDRLAQADINHMTPLAALSLLAELKRELES